jgi:DNA-binding response OmpR family regulator
MSETSRGHIKRQQLTLGEENMPIVLLYSPDMDFCMSLRLLFQDRYHMVTITDPKMLLMTAREFKPDLVIVDSLPTEMMRRRFEMIKQENPGVRIMSFYASQFHNKQVREYFRRSVDAAFSKPIDLREVIASINELIFQGGDRYEQLHRHH